MIRILSLFIFVPAIVGLLLSGFGSGKTRLLGVGTCMVAIYWWLSLSMQSAFTMTAPIPRHPTRFLIPDSYIGWVEVDYGETNAPSLQMDGKTYVCRIPANGILDTSTPLEEGWAKDEYFYYSPDGSTRALKDTGWGQGGMIWGQADEWEPTQDASEPKRAAQYFYVGTEDQYHHAVSSTESHAPGETKGAQPSSTASKP